MKQQLLILVEWAKYIPAFRQADFTKKTKQTLKGQGHEIEFKYFDKGGKFLASTGFGTLKMSLG
jgi:hypothetical protein